MRPTVTVVMPAYDAAALIGEAIESVLTQTFADWELVVVDDGSTDGTADMVRAHADPRVRLLPIEHSGFPAVAKNRGLAASDSRYVAFLDADDVWRPQKLARQVAIVEARPEVGLVHTGFDRLRDGALEPVPTPAGARESGSQLARLATGNYIANSSVLARRELLTRHGAFDESFRIAEDFELWLRLSIHTTFAYLDEPLLVYRVHPSGLSHRETTAPWRVAALEKMERLHPDLVAGLGLPYLKTLGHWRGDAALPGRGRRELLRVLVRSPRDRFAWTWLGRSFLPAGVVRTHGSLRRWAHARLRSRSG